MDLSDSIPDLENLSLKVKQEKQKVLKVSKKSNSNKSNGSGGLPVGSNRTQSTAGNKRRWDENIGNSSNSKRIREHGESNEKPNWKEYKQEKKAIKVERKKSDKGAEEYDIVQSSKEIWEDLRRKDCSAERKLNLSAALYELIKGNLTKFMNTHDMSRVIETLMGTGTVQMREEVLQTFKSNPEKIYEKYSHFVALKLLRHANTSQRKQFCEIYYSLTSSLAAREYSRDVLEIMFEQAQNERHRLKLLQHMYGNAYYETWLKINNNPSDLTLKAHIQAKPSARKKIMEHLEAFIGKLVDKNMPIGYHAFHGIIQQYLSVSTPEESERIIERAKLREELYNISQTKAGANVAMQVFWNTSAKDRKSILKNFGSVSELACNQYGHVVLLAIIDSLDDTVLLKKQVLLDLMRNIVQMMGNTYGRKVIRYLIDPRNKMDLSPEMITCLEQGDNNPFSKKDMVVRRTEVLDHVESTLLNAVIEHIGTWLKDNKNIVIVTSILLKCKGSRHEDALKAVAEYLATKPTWECIGNGGPFQMAKKLIGYKSKEAAEVECDDIFEREKQIHELFTNLLIASFDKTSMTNWIKCSQGMSILSYIRLMYKDNKEISVAVQAAIQNYGLKIQKTGEVGGKS